MRIISKFNDYYDSALGYGVDTTQVLVRKQEEFKGDWTSVRCWGWTKLFAVGFCGKWWYGLRYNRFDGEPQIIAYSVDDIPEKKKYLFKPNPFMDYLDKKEGRYNKWLRGEYKGLNEELFHEFGAACLYYENVGKDQTITTWPVLKDLKFMQFKDPYTAFQDISMYQFGVLGCQEKDVVNISDSDRIVGKGFDPVYGFRKRR